METMFTADPEWFLRQVAELDDVYPLPVCEFCSVEDDLHDDHGVTLCLTCSLKCVLEVEPRLVAHVAVVVARAATARRVSYRRPGGKPLTFSGTVIEGARCSGCTTTFIHVLSDGGSVHHVSPDYLVQQ